MNSYPDCLNYFKNRNKLIELNYKIQDSDYKKYIVKNPQKDIFWNIKRTYTKTQNFDYKLIEEIENIKNWMILNNCKNISIINIKKLEWVKKRLFISWFIKKLPYILGSFLFLFFFSSNIIKNDFFTII